MPKNKAAGSGSNTIIRKPTPKKVIKDFKLTERQCNSLQIDPVFIDLPTIQWSNVTKLVDQSIEYYRDTLESTKVLNSIVISLETIKQNRKNNTTLVSYSEDCSCYLKQGHIKKLFHKTFASRIIKFQTEELKKLNRTQGYRNATLITSQCGNEYYDELLSGSTSNVSFL